MAGPAPRHGMHRLARLGAGLHGPWRDRLWAWYLLASGGLTLLYLLVPPFAGSGPLINLLGLSSSVAIAVGIRLHRPKTRWPWLLFIVGQFLFFAGDLYTYSYPKLLGADVPFPSLGDGLYLTVYPALMAGLFMLVRRRNGGGDRTGMIDSLILTVGVAVLSWVFLIVPSLHVSGLSRLATAVSIAYPLGDLLLLAAVMRLAVDRGRRATAFYLLTASIVSLLTTDSLYTYALLQNTYHHQLSLDAGWIAYYLLWGAAALHPSMRTLEQPSRAPRVRLTRVRLSMLAGASLIAQAIRFGQELGNAETLVLICASVLLYLLVIARMAGLVRGEERAAQLRSAGVELVGAASLQRIRDAAIAAVRAVVCDASEIRLITLADACLTRAQGGEESAAVSESCPGPVAAWITGACSSATHSVPAELRAALAIGENAVALPLSVRGDVRGALVVSSPQLVTADIVEALEALAAQIALAFDGAITAEDQHRRRSEARFRSLVANSSDLITVVDAGGVVLYQSPSSEHAIGYDADELTGRRFQELVDEGDRPRFGHGLDKLVAGQAETETWECAIHHRDGRVRQFEVQARNLLGDEHVQGIVLNSRDVSERKLFEEQLAHQAFHDPVTGLANRALFADRVRHALGGSLRDGRALGLLFIDLDDFKTINDSLGHAAGDHVLKAVAARLQGIVRPNDTVARFGGDEFAVLLEETDGLQGAAYTAERVLGELEQAVPVDGKEVYAQASIGICAVDGTGATVDAEELLRNADVAMYMAKRDGKGRYRVFEPAMHEQVLARLELRSELQRATETGQLAIHYQPVVQLRRSGIYGVEALMRWLHPTRGMIPPSDFIPLAEETGLIVSMGRWLLREACREAAELHASFPELPPVRMSVNLSVKQLQSETIVEDVRAALVESGLAAENLVLEITESVMMADAGLAVQRLTELKALGLRLAMDDFGTGYSSLSYLSRFPVDILKMDRSFLQAGEAESGLAAAIVGLGETLQLDVVAEGIERPEQMQSLQRLGCELGQGWLFARAMPPEALRRFLADEADRRSDGLAA